MNTRIDKGLPRNYLCEQNKAFETTTAAAATPMKNLGESHPYAACVKDMMGVQTILYEVFYYD